MMKLTEIALIVIAIYLVCITIYILFDKLGLTISITKREIGKQQAKQQDKESVFLKNRQEIIGLTSYEPRQTTTITDKPRQSNQDKPKETKFAEKDASEPSARVPENELDETFVNVKFNTNIFQHDYNRDVNIDSEEEDIILLGIDKNLQASGVQIGELDEAVGIAQKATASNKENQKAAEIFSRVSNSDLINQLVDNGSPILKTRIKKLLDTSESIHRANLNKREVKTNFTSNIDFDINQYV